MWALSLVLFFPKLSETLEISSKQGLISTGCKIKWVYNLIYPLKAEILEKNGKIRSTLAKQNFLSCISSDKERNLY